MRVTKYLIIYLLLIGSVCHAQNSPSKSTILPKPVGVKLGGELKTTSDQSKHVQRNKAKMPVTPPVLPKPAEKVVPKKLD